MTRKHLHTEARRLAPRHKGSPQIAWCRLCINVIIQKQVVLRNESNYCGAQRFEVSASPQRNERIDARGFVRRNVARQERNPQQDDRSAPKDREFERPDFGEQSGEHAI